MRRALGAPSAGLIRMVVLQDLLPVVLGLLLGMAGGAGLSRILSALLFEIDPIDPVTFVAVPVLLLGISVLAVWIPARRAGRVDPSVALSAE